MRRIPNRAAGLPINRWHCEQIIACVLLTALGHSGRTRGEQKTFFQSNYGVVIFAIDSSTPSVDRVAHSSATQALDALALGNARHEMTVTPSDWAFNAFQGRACSCTSPHQA